MKNTIYKSLLSSLLITNIWSVIIFFIYFFEDPGWFHGFETFGFFLWSCWISSGLGILIILLSFLKFWKSNPAKVFFLLPFGWFNIFFSILVFITGCFEIVSHEALIELLTNFTISVLIFFRTRKIIKTTI
ncbi:hypothetical protein SAMN05443663_103241 [Flavobacterium defluvii]|uniref:Uncharacterized protein n=1 Tax=Flavobacterium defluvii TaxID=370979 RepID=A0A1M5L312_9FLAO|nr:hypothetical protein SAMN05443663_103241 [Flavobacterium defluvii]